MINWEKIFQKLAFPAYMKPFAGGGWKSVYRVENPDDLFAKHAETEQLVTILQEEIVFEDYYRVYCLGRKYVHIMPYEPRNPHHLRYVTESKYSGGTTRKHLKNHSRLYDKMNEALVMISIL